MTGSAYASGHRYSSHGRATSGGCGGSPPTLPSLFGWFATQLAASRSRPDSACCAVAYDRVLEPFLEAGEVNGVEVGWEELAKSLKAGDGASPKGTKLWKVLEYGMRRELLLLDRAPEGTRCKSTAKAEFDKEMSIRALQQYLIDSTSIRG